MVDYERIASGLVTTTRTAVEKLLAVLLPQFKKTIQEVRRLKPARLAGHSNGHSGRSSVSVLRGLDLRDLHQVRFQPKCQWSGSVVCGRHYDVCARPDADDLSRVLACKMESLSRGVTIGDGRILHVDIDSPHLAVANVRCYACWVNGYILLLRDPLPNNSVYSHRLRPVVRCDILVASKAQ